MKSAIIVGAGLAGLTAGYRLRRAGWNVNVIEASPEVGGRAVSVRKQGYLFDSGAVGLGTVYRDYMDLVDEVGLKDSLVKSTTVSATLRNGKVHEIDTARPLTALTSGFLSFRSKLKLVNLFRDLGKVKPKLDIRDVAAAAEFDDETIEAYARRRLNPEILEYFIEPLARTVNLTRARSVSKLEVMNSLAGLFDTTLVTLKGGVGVFAQALARDLDVTLNASVTRVRKRASGVEVDYTGSNGQPVTATADVCVLATTLPQALALYPEGAVQMAPLADMISYNRGLCVHLGYKAATRTKSLMVMMPPGEEPEIALFFLEHNKGPDRAPPGHSMITVFFDDTAADRPWGLPEEQLIRETAAKVEKVLPELAGRLEMSHVTRWPLGLTNPVQGIYKAMERVNTCLDPADPVQFTGDYRSTAGQNSAVAWGNNVARAIIANHP